MSLPSDYVAVLRRFDGGEGFVGDGSYLMLWKAEELATFNEEYSVREYCPGVVLFCSSGGGEAFAFDAHESSWWIVRVPFVGMSRELIEPLADSFSGFLEVLAAEGD